MTLAEARTWMINNPGKKITCKYFHNEWIMYDAKKRQFIFEDGVRPTCEWWSTAKHFDCEWYELH